MARSTVARVLLSSLPIYSPSLALSIVRICSSRTVDSVLRPLVIIATWVGRAAFVLLQRSACDWTQVSLLLLLFMAFGADAPHRPTQKVVWLIGFADGRRKVKDALYYSVFKERAEAIEKAPSLSMPKS